MSTRISLLGGLLGALTLSARASAPDDSQILDPVIVRGDLIGNSVQQALRQRKDAGNATVVIDGEQLNQFNDLSVGDAIRRLPGVTFPGVNRSRDVRLRAIGGEYTQILLDGRRYLDGNSSRNMEVDRLPAAMIERIEIIRSPLAGQPAGGIAGTINIVTRRGSSEPSGGASFGAGHVEGNGNTGDLAVWQGAAAGPLRWFIAANAQRRLLEESSTEFEYDDDAFDGGDDQLQKRRFNEYTLTPRLDFELGANDRLSLVPNYNRSEERRDQSERAVEPDGSVSQRTEEIRDRTRETWGNRTEWTHRLGDHGTITTYHEFSRASEDTERNSRRYNAAGEQNRVEQRFSDVAMRNWNAGVVYTATKGRHAIDAGLGVSDGTREEAESRFRNGSPQTPDYGRIYEVGEEIAHAWVSDAISLSDADLLTLGLRAEHSRTRTTAHDGTRASKKATDLIPSVQYRRAASDNVDLRIGLARTLRRPDLRDLTPTIEEGGGTIGDPDTAGNPQTSPERAWGLDAGLDWFLDEERGLLSANIFARRISDKIEERLRLVDDRWLQRPENAGDGRILGMELEARLPLTFAGLADLVLWGNVTRVHSRLDDALTGQRRRFDQQPDLVSNIGLDYFIAPIRTTVGFNYNRVFDYSQTFAITDGGSEQTRFGTQNRMDLSLRTQLGASTSLSLSALNVLRAKDRRDIVERNEDGAINSTIRYREPSNMTWYARIKHEW